MTPGEQPPIACSLDAESFGDRVGEWREFGRVSVTAIHHDGTTARFQLAPGDQVLTAAASLAQREKQCCPFFDFSIKLEPSECWLQVSVPPDAGEVLTSLVGLLQSA